MLCKISKTKMMTQNINNSINTLTVDVCISLTVCDDSYKFNTDTLMYVPNGL